MKRTQAVIVRLTDKEKQHLERQAQNAGLKMEPFIRKLIMGADIRPRPPDNVAELIRAIGAVGNNINQIARKVNAYDDVSRSDMEEVRRLLSEIYRAVKEQ